MYVYLERKDGSDGDISCMVKTTAGSALGGKKEAVEGEDFMIINERYTFPHGSSDLRIKVTMPNCFVETKKDGDEEGVDVVTFALEISDPTPGVKISKKNICFIDITPEDKAGDE
jgi:hypothetical protein